MPKTLAKTKPMLVNPNFVDRLLDPKKVKAVIGRRLRGSPTEFGRTRTVLVF